MNDDDGIQPTRWSLIRALQESDSLEARQRYLDDIARIYHPVIHGFFERKGCPSHTVDDLTQEFFRQKVLERSLFDKADRNRGRLRSFLYAALENFHLDALRKSATCGRQKERLIDPLELNEHHPRAEVKRFFDQDWASAILAECVQIEEERDKSSGRENRWRAFDLRILQPTVYGTRTPHWSEIAERCSFNSHAAAASAVRTVKNRMIRLLKTVVGETVIDEREVDDELKLLRSILAVLDGN